MALNPSQCSSLFHNHPLCLLSATYSQLVGYSHLLCEKQSVLMRSGQHTFQYDTSHVCQHINTKATIALQIHVHYYQVSNDRFNSTLITLILRQQSLWRQSNTKATIPAAAILINRQAHAFNHLISKTSGMSCSQKTMPEWKIGVFVSAVLQWEAGKMVGCSLSDGPSPSLKIKIFLVPNVYLF